MRRKEFYFLKGNNNDIFRIMKIVFPNNYNEIGIVDNLYTDTSEYKRLLEECNTNGVKLLFRRFETEYTKLELESARYFLLNINSFCSEFSEKYGTEFSYKDKCSCCGAGRIQTSDLYIDKKKMNKKDISVTYDLEWVISERLYRLLKENGVSGALFGNVFNKKMGKTKNEVMMYQLIAQNILPVMNNKAQFHKEKYCECCQKNGLFLHSLPCYNSGDLRDAKDFNYSAEFFGSNFSSRPYVIVSQKVYRIFKENNIKGVTFDIVQID